MKPLYYDKAGNPYDDVKAWAKLFEDNDYKIIKQEYTPKGKYWISTVWLGIDHSFGGNSTPLIFESMVFGAKHGKHDFSQDYDQMRYPSEKLALAGHETLLKYWTQKERKATKKKT
jgi:hypothetical protein